MLNRDALIRKLSGRATITVECLLEDESIRGNASAIDPATDREIEAEIVRQLDAGNPWAWCSIRVTASFDGFSGSDHLGCCSYASEADFRRSGGYYDDMRAQAVEQLADEILRADSALARLR